MTMSTVSRPFWLKARYHQESYFETQREESRAEFIRHLELIHIENARFDRVYTQIIISGRQAEVVYCQLDDESAEIEAQFILRGRNIYYPPREEYLKSIVLLVHYPLHSICVKLFHSNSEPPRDSRKLTALKVLVSSVAHPLIGVFGLVPGLSNYFNKLGGDLERWSNGHKKRELEDKSGARRAYEMPYAAICQQPIFKFPDGIELERNISVNSLEGRTQNLAFRTILGCYFATSRPVILYKI